jgi:subtilisin family serine protease
MLPSLAVLLVLGSIVDVRVEPPPPAGRVIVEFERTRSAGETIERFRHDLASIDRRSGKRGLDPVRHHYTQAMAGVAVNVPAEAVDELRRLPYVRAVYPDGTMHATVIEATGAPARIEAVSLPTRGEGIVVAIIDSGVDYNHDALGRGFGPGHKVAAGWDFVAGDADPLDEMGHGTHVAGIIAGDSAELTGVAPGATIYAYRVLNGMGAGSFSDIIAAIDRSIDPNQDGNPSDHVDVINMSLGGPGSADDPVSRAVDRATAAGIVVVVAAGNAGQPSSIGSPGTARTAITVGAITDAGAVTTFSSRGPGPALLTFKPDVVAPGFEVVSARLGGGLVPMSGTSMASPYVAGVAALLENLHPGWTPAEVRSALVTTATPIADSPVARGAGRVAAERANAAATFVDTSGLSFGIAPGTTGSWEAKRTVTVTNRAAAARTIDVASANAPAGATLTATPARLQLAPGASQAVELKLRIDNAAMAFPDQPALSGVIAFGGEEPFDLPWIVMRTARLTLASDLFTSHFVAVSPMGLTNVATYDFYNGEFFAPPGTTWSIAAMGVESGDQHGPRVRFVTARDQLMAGDRRVAFLGASASAELVFDVHDETGRALVDAERERGGTNRWMTVAVEPAAGQVMRFHLGSWERIFASPTPWTVQPLQASWDQDRDVFYNIQHRPLAGITGSKTLTVNAADYLHAVVDFGGEDLPEQRLFGMSLMTGSRGGGAPLRLQSLLGGWFGPLVRRAPRVHYYTTNESGNSVFGIGFILTGESQVPALRGIDGAIVSSDFEVSPADYRIADDEEVHFGATAVFPLAFFGTTGGILDYRTVPGFHGPAGEWSQRATQGSAWTLYDAANAFKSGGTVAYGGGPAGAAGERLVVVRDGMKVGGMDTRGELEVHFGNDGNDLVPPTLTSLRVVDGQGRIAASVPRNSGAALHFAAADIDYTLDNRTRAMKPEATRAWYRASGAGTWLPLPVAFQRSDNGSFMTLGRMPAGDLYRVDLSSTTAGSGGVDLRVEIEDAAGNRSSWTLAPAFAVTAPKRRSASPR